MLTSTFAWILFNIVTIGGVVILCSRKIGPILKKYNLNKLSVWIGGVLLGSIGILFTYQFSLKVWRFYPEQEFNQAVWSAYPYERYKMVNDLIESKALVGKTRTETEQLLGREGREVKNGVHWKYFTGRLPGPFSLLPHVIDIEFRGDTILTVTRYNDRH